MFVDCFDRELVDGEDVLFSRYVDGKNTILCGFVFHIDDDEMTILYQMWKGEKEITKNKTFKANKDSNITKLQNIYKIVR